MRPNLSAKARKLTTAALTAILLAAPVALHATTIIVPTDEQLIAKSPVIVSGVIESSRAVDRNGAIWTETILDVEKVLRGDVEKKIVIREVGGHIGDRFNIVFGTPQYITGQRVLVFLWPTGKGDYQTRDLFIGQFVERKTVSGERLWYRSEESAGTSLLNQSLQETKKTSQQRDASRFEDFVSAKLAGRDVAPSYFVSNPQYARTAAPEFTLLNDPSLYRWFAFDDGKTVEWKSIGGASGYGDGGITELKSAFSAWNSYSQANIRYTYTGVSDAAPGGLATPNGVNEILFGDPLNEIDGRWEGSGVLGRGGFNNVRGPRGWTSPFAGDAAHPARAFNDTQEILEANVVIQDGVAAWAGVSGTALAELLSHELGHTLGFGHSKDSGALMYASLRSVGPQLRDDDQLAARWLYPTSSAAAPPPTVSVPAAVSAEFLVSNELPAVNQNVLLADRSSGAPTTWSWSFGDGQTSTVQNPSHVYAAPGVYAVTLTASNGYSSGTRTRMITVSQAGEVFRSLVPVAAQTEGVAATHWRTELTIFNAGSELAEVHVRFVSGDGASPLTRTLQLRPEESISYRNALYELFGLTSGTGALAIEARNASQRPELRISSRTFTDDENGSYGQFVPETGDYLPTDLYLTGIAVTPDFRTNIGLVNRGSVTVTTELQLFDASGAVVAKTTVSVSPASFQQMALSNLFPHATIADGFYSISLQSSLEGLVTAYASVIDNRSQDPVFISARPAPLTGELVIPAAVHSAGAEGTYWKTDLTMFNPNASEISLEVSMLNAPEQKRSVSIGANATVAIDDLIAWLGTPQTQGALMVRTFGDEVAPVIATRIFTTRATDGGTYGQSVEPSEPAGFTEKASLTGLRWDGRYRTNLGFVNSGDGDINVIVTLLGENGIRETTTIGVPGHSSLQRSASSVFPNIESVGAFSIEATTSPSAEMLAYASMIDNVSGDPVFVTGR